MIGLIINAIGRSDPSASIRIKLELAEKYLNETREYMSKGYAVQVSEKLYKATEECIKALAKKLTRLSTNRQLRRASGIQSIYRRRAIP